MKKTKSKKKKVSRRVRQSKARRSKQSQKKKVSPQIDPPGELSFVEFQNPFRHLSEEEREKAVSSISETSKELVKESRNSILKIFQEFEPLNIISTIASNGMLHSVNDDGVQTSDSDLEIYQAQIEILMALYLTIEPGDLGKNLPSAEHVQIVWDAIKSLTSNYSFQDLADERSEEERKLAPLVSQIRHSTMLVRGWGTQSQMISTVEEMYSPLDEKILAQEGFTVTQLVELIRRIIGIVSMKIGARYEFLREIFAANDNMNMVDKYFEMLGLDDSERADFDSSVDVNNLSKQQLFSILMGHFDSNAEKLNSFSVSDIEGDSLDSSVVAQMLNKLSMSSGDLSEFEVDHIFLGNPVWKKPLIRLEGGQRFYCGVPGSMLDHLPRTIEQNIAPTLRSEISDLRSDYLESKVFELLKDKFPEAVFLPNFKWSLDGAKYETDLLVYIAPILLVVECKSGAITEPALRGGTLRIQKHIDEILVAPNLQALRFEEKFNTCLNDKDSDKSFMREMPEGISSVTRVVSISVALEDFAAIQSNIETLKEAGLVDKSLKQRPVFSLPDFETTLDLLEKPYLILHYMSRRSEIEGELSYHGDEWDLLGIYLSNLFNFGDVPKDHNFEFSGASDPIDKYYLSIEAGCDVQKPRVRFSEHFSGVFALLEHRAPDSWIEICILLCMMPPADQNRMHQRIQTLGKRVKRTGKSQSVHFIPGGASGYAIAVCVFPEGSCREERHKHLATAAQHTFAIEKIHTCVVIGHKFANIGDAAYDIIGVFRADEA